MLYAFICTDKPNSLTVRQQFRPDHVKHVQGLGAALKFAGPFLSDDGSPIGSLLVIEAADRKSAQEIASNDPYNKAGLFASVDIRAWKWAMNAPPGV
jgi:uncharacterized protein